MWLAVDHVAVVLSAALLDVDAIFDLTTVSAVVVVVVAAAQQQTADSRQRA